jgi:uncharacterized membrane protein YphA (DoxX/SURF4 family)
VFVATAIVSSLLALLLIASGRSKLLKEPRQMEIMRSVEFPDDKVWLLAAAEIVGAVGIVAGLFWGPVGIAAAIGVTFYFLGAVSAHLRVGHKYPVPALVMLPLRRGRAGPARGVV